MRSDCHQGRFCGIPGLKSETWGTRMGYTGEERIACR
jgi:hypothetical protein